MEILREIWIWRYSTASTRIPAISLHLEVESPRSETMVQWYFQKLRLSVFLFFTFLIFRNIISHGYGDFKNYIITLLCSSQDESRSPYCVYQGVCFFPEAFAYTSSYLIGHMPTLQPFAIHGEWDLMLGFNQSISGPGNCRRSPSSLTYCQSKIRVP